MGPLTLRCVTGLGPVRSVGTDRLGIWGFLMTMRFYDVVALRVPIAFDAHGDHDRQGMIFALGENADALREIAAGWPDPFPDPVEHPELMPAPDPLVRPLVLRANVGDRVAIMFRNHLDRPAGIHVQGVGYDVDTMDGGQVGRNADSAARAGGRRSYVWECTDEGVFFFHDLADIRGGEDGSNAHGLFGALVVEPAGAQWTDPVTGRPVVDGLYADIHVPGQPSFREYVVFMQDEAPNDNPVKPPHPTYECDLPRPHGHSVIRGEERLVPTILTGDDEHGHGGHAGEAMDSMMVMSYRTEPMGWRALAYERLLEQGRIDPARDAIVGEEQHHSSWLFGDPATPILRAYKGDRREDPARARGRQGDPRLPPAPAPVARGAGPRRGADHRLDLDHAAAGVHDRADRWRGLGAARDRRHHLALPPLPALPLRHVGYVAGVRQAAGRLRQLPGRHADRGAAAAARPRAAGGADRAAARASRRSSPASTRRSRPARRARR